MYFRSLKFFKLLLFLILIIISINFFFRGYILLNKNKVFIVLDDKNLNKKKITNEVKEGVKKIKLKTKNIYTSKLKEKIIIVKKNDTFIKIIDPYVSNNKLKNKIINEISKKFNLKNLKINQKIYLYFDQNKNLKKIILPINYETDLVLLINKNKIDTYEEKIKLNKEIVAIEFVIINSLYKSGIEAGIPNSILADAIKLYSFDLDFQRDIKKNTIVKISYEIFTNTKRNNLSYGNIEYINLIINNKDLEYFLFETDDNFLDYFNRDGKNVKKSILKTPIDGARLSSNFGMRKHPISGYNKMHKGVDFAAPKGTPIFAGGNGTIEFVGTNGGYGKFIKIRHNNEYKTAYAHLSKFKKGIKKGVRVNQGDIIGYVGNTGNSTGPHLHYEIIYNNKPINPMKLKLPSGKVLTGNELKRFNKNYKKTYARYLFALFE